MAPMERPLILVADDNEGHLRVMEMVLTAMNYEVTVARNGHEALTFLQSSTPALFFLDVQMPFMSGLDVLRRVRRLERLAGVPAVVMTSLEPSEVAPAIADLTPARVVNKPLTGKNLRQLVTEALAEGRASAAA